MANILEINNLTFAYEKKIILDNISFSLEEGKVGVLVGLNGAGKTTILKNIANIVKTKQGEIILDGKNKNDYKPNEYATKIAYVPQIINYESATVIDTILIGRIPMFYTPSKQDYEKVYDVIEQLHIEHLATENVQKLSGGEKQKIAIARALAGEAKLMLFDEPTANLDLKGQYETMELIRSLKDKGVSVLISMHDINHALDVGDDFIVLKDKKVLCTGNSTIMTEELLHDIYGMDFEMIEHRNKKHFHIKGDHTHEE